MRELTRQTDKFTLCLCFCGGLNLLPEDENLQPTQPVTSTKGSSQEAAQVETAWAEVHTLQFLLLCAEQCERYFVERDELNVKVQQAMSRQNLKR